MFLNITVYSWQQTFLAFVLDEGEVIDERDWFPHVYDCQFERREMSDVSKIGSISFIKTNEIILYLYFFGARAMYRRYSTEYRFDMEFVV